jgi:hypothetical protein
VVAPLFSSLLLDKFCYRSNAWLLQALGLLGTPEIYLSIVYIQIKIETLLLTDQDSSRSRVSVNGPNGHVSSLSCTHLKPFKRSYSYLCVAALIGLLLAVATSVTETMALPVRRAVKNSFCTTTISSPRVGRGCRISRIASA